VLLFLAEGVGSSLCHSGQVFRFAQLKTRNEAIIKFYQSGGYTMKEIGGYSKIHYSSVSRIVAACKK
jgi:DNA-binding MarR family transcriptional regulator